MSAKIVKFGQLLTQVIAPAAKGVFFKHSVDYVYKKILKFVGMYY